jgi:hypothetical protein
MSLLQIRYVAAVHYTPGHWCLVVVDTIARKVVYYDSALAGKYAYVGIEYTKKFLTEMAIARGWDSLDIATFEDVTFSSPAQPPGVDCGICVLLMLERLAQDPARFFDRSPEAVKTFSPLEMKRARAKWACALVVEPNKGPRERIMAGLAERELQALPGFRKGDVLSLAAVESAARDALLATTAADEAQAYWDQENRGAGIGSEDSLSSPTKPPRSPSKAMAAAKRNEQREQMNASFVPNLSHPAVRFSLEEAQRELAAHADVLQVDPAQWAKVLELWASTDPLSNQVPGYHSTSMMSRKDFLTLIDGRMLRDEVMTQAGIRITATMQHVVFYTSLALELVAPHQNGRDGSPNGRKISKK